MNRDELMIACLCLIDDVLPIVLEGKRLGQGGFEPTLSASEVITMEIVGSYLGYNQDKALFDYFRFHWNHFFPSLLQVDRTTFLRQAANLWALKERIWCLIRESLLPYDPSTAIIDSFPLPVCPSTRAARTLKGRPVLAKIKVCNKPSVAFVCIVAWPGLLFSRTCTCLLPTCMKRTGSRSERRHDRLAVRRP